MAAYLARLLGVAVFAASAVGHITNFKGDTAYLSTSLSALSKVYGFDVPPQNVIEILMGVAIGLLVLGSTLLGLGINDHLGSLFLILFLLPVTPIMHPFWILPAGSEKQMLQMAMFLKNTSLLGLLLYVNGRSHAARRYNGATKAKTQ